MQEDIVEIISNYENNKNLPESERCTEYQEEFGFYVMKLDVSKGLLNERLAEAKEAMSGKYSATGKKITAVLQIKLGHNVFDKQSYSLATETEMINDFVSSTSIDKMIGVKIGEETYFLVRKQENVPFELVTLPFDLEIRQLERVDEIRTRWYNDLLKIEREETQQKLNEIIATGERTSAKQDKFNYLKEIEKRMKIVKKYFLEERMEGYDFREVELSGAIFMFCDLTGSNFCGVNLTDVVFVECSMKDCLFIGAKLNGCKAYYGGEILNLEDKTRKIQS